MDTVATHLGELVTGSQMTALPLNGRSYTDLLPIQPGVTPVSTLLPNSVIMAGVTGGLSPSGDLNPGNLSIDGQRESSNGFLVDGIDVQEHMNGGTSIVANLDSIDEFRVLTNNFDPEYGNYNGGMVTVITKSGSDSFHGNAFEFLAQHSFGCPRLLRSEPARLPAESVWRNARRPSQASESLFLWRLSRHTDERRRGNGGNLGSVDSRIAAGNLSDVAGSLTGKVSGSNIASLLSAKLQLWSYDRGALLPGVPERGDSHERMVGAGLGPAALHSFTQYWHRSIFHFGLSTNRARR